MKAYPRSSENGRFRQRGLISQRELNRVVAGVLGLMGDAAALRATILHRIAAVNQGTVRDIVDSSGTDVDHLTYNAFGVLTGQTGSGAYGPTDVIFAGYTGSFCDSATGLVHDGARWYSPVLQRWLSHDPIFPMSGANPSQYCGNRPTSAKDPTGLVTFSIGPTQGFEFFFGFNASEEITLSMPNADLLDVPDWRFGVAVSEGGGATLNNGWGLGVTAGVSKADRPEQLNGRSGSVSAGGGELYWGRLECSNINIPNPENHPVKVSVSAGMGYSAEPVDAGVAVSQTDAASISPRELWWLFRPVVTSLSGVEVGVAIGSKIGEGMAGSNAGHGGGATW